MPKIPLKVSADVMFLSNLKCCVCQEKGEHIHHLNSNDSDNRLDNLALLCFDHHHEATIKGGLKRKLSKETIIKFRDNHYHTILIEREKAKAVFSHPVDRLTDDKLLEMSMSAQMILEIDRMHWKYDSSEWGERYEIITNLSRFSRHANHRVVHETLDFLESAASQCRAKMPESIAIQISTVTMDFLPSFYEDSENPEKIQLAKKAIHIGSIIAYDAFIYLKNLPIAMWGLSIIKYVYREAKKENVNEIVEAVLKEYDELESTLKRPERTDLGPAQELLKTFRKDLDDWDLSWPILSEELEKRVDADSEENSKHELETTKDLKSNMKMVRAVLDLLNKFEVKKN